MKIHLLLALIAPLCLAASDSSNLIPNGDMKAADPGQGFFISFPDQGAYVKNADFVKPGKLAGRTCVVMEGDDKYMGVSGLKVMSPLAKIEGGKHYKASVDLYRKLPQTHFKVFAELYAIDPHPEMSSVQTGRIPAGDGHPALVLVYKRDFQWKGGIPPEEWTKVETDLVAPTKEKVKVFGKPAEVTYATIKVLALGSGTKDFIHTAGASHFELK